MSRRRAFAITAATAALGLGVAGCGASSSTASSSAPVGKSSTAAAIPAPNHKQLTLLFGSSGPPETAAVTAAAKAFTAKTGIPVSVLPAANKTEELAQDFAGNQPPNLFYLGPTSFQSYARKGVLDPYASQLGNASDFYSSLTSAFTYKGQLVCDPKDASTLSLYINNADWKAAGLTSADYPKNWSQLASVAKRLTTDGRVGLVTDPSESRLDAFFYQDGGRIFNSSRTKVVLDSSANVKALDFVKSMLTAKTLAYPSQLSSGDGEDAFGANKAAMVITGNWMTGTMKNDYPSVSYTPLALPAGPTGTAGDLTFTNCWGVPTTNDNLGGTVEFIKYLTSPAQEMRFFNAFGPIPSLKSLASSVTKEDPGDAEILTSLQTGHPDIELAGDTEAITAFNSALAQLATTSPSSILSTAQTNLQAVLNQGNSQGG